MEQEIQIFKSCRDIVDDVYKILNQMSNFHRYNMGNRLLNTGFEMLNIITLANMSKIPQDRLKYLFDFEVAFQQFRLYIRFCREHTLFRPDVYSNFILKFESISKQLVGWKKQTQSRLES